MQSIYKDKGRFLLNYRTIFTYFMTVSYLCVYYFVSVSDLEPIEPRSNSIKASKIGQPNDINSNNRNYHHNMRKSPVFNSKKLLNYKNGEHIFYEKSKRLNKVYSSPRRRYTISNANATVKKNHVNIFIVPPRAPNVDYNLKNRTSKYFSQIYQDRILMHLLNSTYFNRNSASSDGLFIEAGAYDGETWSNTLYLERSMNWTGVLVEPSSETFSLLRSKNRRAYLANNCLCSGKLSKNSSYIEAGPFGMTTNLTGKIPHSSSHSPIVLCHPLSKIIDAFFDTYPQFKNKRSRIANANHLSNQTIVDYLSLDVEGDEKEIIETFPFEEYRFNFLNVEYNQNDELYKWLKNYLNARGYVETLRDDLWHQDAFFAHKSIINNVNIQYKTISEFVKNVVQSGDANF